MNIMKEFHDDVETGIRVVSNKIVIWEIKCKLLDMTICMTPMVLEVNAKMCVISSDAGDRVRQIYIEYYLKMKCQAIAL